MVIVNEFCSCGRGFAETAEHVLLHCAKESAGEEHGETTLG